MSTVQRHPGSLLEELGLAKKQLLALLEPARELKRATAEGTEKPQLAGRNLALIFQKSLTRKLCSFEVVPFDHGAHITYLGPSGSHIGVAESIADTARVLGRIPEAIGALTDAADILAGTAGTTITAAAGAQR